MIGQMDELITLQANTRAADGGGGQVDSWANFATDPTVWAKVDPRAGGEGVDGGAFNAAGLWKFVIWYRDDVSELDRILWNGDYYNIRRVARARQSALYLDLFAERGVPQ